MAAKYFCDKCGKEQKADDLSTLAHNSTTMGDMQWDLCNGCFTKFRTEFVPKPVYITR